jgi:hypothetical protein
MRGKKNVFQHHADKSLKKEIAIVYCHAIFIYMGITIKINDPLPKGDNYFCTFYLGLSGSVLQNLVNAFFSCIAY